MKTQILFVDDEPNVLSGLRRMLRRQSEHWQMHFAGGGEVALAIMEQESIDVIVSDMRMPGMDGAELLRLVAERYPQTARLVLSGQSSHERVFRAIGPAHQFLSKPCQADDLIDAVHRVSQLRKQLNSDAMHRVILGIESLPPVPQLYRDLVEILESDDASIDRVGDIIGGDLAMSAKVLQWVNSSFFGLPQHVSCPKHAVSLLGLDIIRPLTLSAGAFGHFESIDFDGFSVNDVAEHGLAVATTARQIALKHVAGDSSQERQMVDDAFIAGMLHDIGKLLLASSFPGEYREACSMAQSAGVPIWMAERDVFGTSHAEIGGHLLDLWGLPYGIVEATSLHHQPSLCLGNQFRPLTAVHAANAWRHQRDGSNDHQPTESWDRNYLESLGLETPQNA